MGYLDWPSRRTCNLFLLRWHGAKPIIPTTIFHWIRFCTVFAIGFYPDFHNTSLSFSPFQNSRLHYEWVISNLVLILPFILSSWEFRWLLRRGLFRNLGLIWLCMYGIQFPTDPMMDHFLSSVCVCVWGVLFFLNTFSILRGHYYLIYLIYRKAFAFPLFDLQWSVQGRIRSEPPRAYSWSASCRSSRSCLSHTHFGEVDAGREGLPFTCNVDHVGGLCLGPDFSHLCQRMTRNIYIYIYIIYIHIYIYIIIYAYIYIYICIYIYI